MYIELQSGMAVPSDFPKAVRASTAVMFAAYVVVGSAGYYYLGREGLKSGDPITSDIGGAALRAANAFLLVHVMIAYVIETNVLVRGYLHVVGNDAAATGTTPRDRTTWFTACVAVIGCAFAVSNVVPFFSDIMGLWAALGATMLMITLPALMALKLLPLKAGERAFLQALVPLSLLLAVGGSLASVTDIVQNFVLGSVFSCG
jgi:Ni,Fe-hydrogenase I cytochrome b subunit